MSTIEDIINAAKEESPSNFQTAFNDLLLNKIADAVQARKQEIAQNFFNQEEDSAEQEQSEEQPEDAEQQEDATDENTEATAGSQ